MLRVLEKIFETMVAKKKLLDESKCLEHEKKEKNKVQNKRGSGPTCSNLRPWKQARVSKLQRSTATMNSRGSIGLARIFFMSIVVSAIRQVLEKVRCML